MTGPVVAAHGRQEACPESRSCRGLRSVRGLKQPRWARLLPDDVPGLPVLAQRDEPGMPEVVIRSPLEEFELTDEHRLEPPALGHLGLRQTLAPSPALRLGQVHERALA